MHQHKTLRHNNHNNHNNTHHNPLHTTGKVADLLALLLRCAGGADECAAAVAECLGQLALAAPGSVIGALADALPDAPPAVRCAAAGAVKSMMGAVSVRAIHLWGSGGGASRGRKE